MYVGRYKTTENMLLWVNINKNKQAWLKLTYKIQTIIVQNLMRSHLFRYFVAYLDIYFLQDGNNVNLFGGFS